MFSEFELSTPLSMRVTAPPLSEVGEQEWGAGQAGAAVTFVTSLIQEIQDDNDITSR